MASHALACRDGIAFGKAMLNRVPGFILWNGRVGFDIIKFFVGC